MVDFFSGFDADFLKFLESATDKMLNETENENDFLGKICSEFRINVFLDRNLPFIGVGDIFTVGNIFQLGEPVEVKVLWMHFPKDLSQTSLTYHTTEQSIYTEAEKYPPTRFVYKLPLTIYVAL